MRSRHSAKHTTTTKCMEMEQQQKEPHLSGAYIRSLVKQLSSSRPKESPQLTTDPNSDHPQFSHHSPPPPPSPQPPKKQVRRRLHTSRPYQERLLNMAEARREIVTALKFHRASMKQASQEQQQQTPIPPLISPPPNPSPNCPYQQYQSFCWAYPPIVSIPINNALAFPLPNQPLGLNLSFQGFHDMEIPIPMSNQIPASSLSASSSSSSVESSVEVTPPIVVGNPNASTLHPVMDAEDMREIRSLSDQHDMEWNDTMNLVTTAWWSKVLGGGGERETLFDEAAGVPAWLTDGARGDPAMKRELQQCFEGCLQEELPCLDIEGIDGLNMDWL